MSHSFPASQRDQKTGQVTVLLSVYAGSRPADVDVALQSVWEQTLPAEQVLVIQDGPISKELERLLQQHQQRHPELVRFPLPTNRGLGAALQAGLGQVTTEFVARLDSDDVAAPHRLHTQLEFLRRHPEVAVVGSAVAEFDDVMFRATGSVQQAQTKVRSLPLTHEEIVRYARFNSPLNHPSVTARAEALRQVGGYQSVHFMEDYDLWARLISRGYVLYNLAEPLTFFRTSDEQVKRRTGRDMWAAEVHMQRNLVGYGVVSRPRAVLNFVLRMGYRLLPKVLLARVYSVLFHR